MKVKEDRYGFLLLDGKPWEGAEESYREGRLVEAFALLHAWVEWNMVNLYEMNFLRSGRPLYDLMKEGIMQNYRFPWLRSQLMEKKLLKPHEDQRLGEWYDTRNRIIHRLVAYAYHNYDWNKITRTEVDAGFKEGQALIELLNRRTLEQSPIS